MITKSAGKRQELSFSGETHDFLSTCPTIRSEVHWAHCITTAPNPGHYPNAH